MKEKIKYLINMYIAFILYFFKKKKFSNRKIWLIGGNAGELYVDNASAIHEYLLKQKYKKSFFLDESISEKDIEVYWVANKNSIIKNKINGEILEKGSVKNYLYFMNAQCVLFSHSISADISPYLFVCPIVNKFHYKVLKVFLNHGTVGFKKNKAMNNRTSKIVEKLVKSYDINICDSEFEKNIKINKWWQVPKNTAFVTGYPRYDKLYDSIENIKNVDSNYNKNTKKEIFFMPTWRNWIKSDNKNIESTKYFKNIIGLLTNERFIKYLNDENITVNVFIHQLMHDYFNEFQNVKLNSRINILPKDTKIFDESIKANMLITDYSSIAYDFLFMRKPILFFQFDEIEYQEKVGSYVNLNNQLFGEKAKCVDECVDKIIEISKNGFKYSENSIEKINELSKLFLKYRDNKNSDRIYSLIEEKLKRKNK